MPNLGGPEILVILLVALIVLGPKRLPEVGRQVGKAMRELRKVQSDVRAQLDDVLQADAPAVSTTAAPSIAADVPSMDAAGATTEALTGEGDLASPPPGVPYTAPQPSSPPPPTSSFD